MGKIFLTHEEELAIESILAIMSRKAQHTLSVPVLLEKWENFVSEVEGSYDDSIYEYTNDISVRDLLQTVFDNSPSTLRNKLTGALQVLDDRFLLATEGVNRSVLPNKEKAQAWWWFRVPIKKGLVLQGDLRNEGIIYKRYE